MITQIKTYLFTLLIIASFNINASIIYAEDFSGSHKSLRSAGWSDSDHTSGLELYRHNSSKRRGMRGVYDHDNNPLTPDIPILGALEVNDDAGNVLLMSEIFTVNQEVNYWETGVLSFYSGVRKNNADGAYVELVNLTKDISLTGQLMPNFNGSTWTFNSFEFGWSTTQQGDELQITFAGGGSNSANGQQVADISLVKVPAPSTIILMCLGAAGVVLRRVNQKG